MDRQWLYRSFNDTSTFVGHFVWSPREREKRDRRDSRGAAREGQGRKRNRNESEETEEIKTFPQYPYLLQWYQALPNCKPISVGRPGDIRYMTPLPHLNTPDKQTCLYKYLADCNCKTKSPASHHGLNINHLSVWWEVNCRRIYSVDCNL